jgi:hypothetical protein
MILINSEYGTVIQSLLINKLYSIDALNWTLKMIIKYFVIRSESKSKNYGLKK